MPQCSRAARDALKLAVKSTPGIVMHGRVNQRELAEAMLGASVWFYPTWFSETSCITAMEAQAAGLVPVCPTTAALHETVPIRIWSNDPAADCIRAMTRREQIMAERVEYFKGRPLDFSLDTLADAWETRLNKLVTDAAANVAPKFHEVAR